MALKLKISQEAFEKLSDEVKKEYVEKDGGYVLDVDGIEDTGALKRAKDREAQKRRDAEQELKEAREKLADLDDEDSRKKGDIETLEKSWSKKNSDLEESYQTKIQAKDSFIKQTLVDNVANKIANEISSSPSLILPHIKERLLADLDGDSPSTKVLDSQGKLSALSLEELQQEFVDNKDFSAIIVASKASGSGTPPDAGSQRKFSGANGSEGKLLSQMTPVEVAAHVKASREERNQ